MTGQAHDSDYVSVYDHVRVQVHVQVHVSQVIIQRNSWGFA